MIGIFGGTFDPVHYGHLRAATEVKDIFGLSQLRLIPCAQPAHRMQPLASAVMRVQMLQLAIADHSDFIIDTRELERHGNSYTVDTLTTLRDEFLDSSLLLFIGSDAFQSLTHWYHWQQLFELAHIVVMTRPGYEIPPLDGFFNSRLTLQRTDLQQKPAGKLFFQTITLLDISATTIRQLIAEQRNPDFLLPPAVIRYIAEQGLYQTL